MTTEIDGIIERDVLRALIQAGAKFPNAYLVSERKLIIELFRSVTD